MPRRAQIEQLPAAVRRWLDGALVDGNFSGYAQLEDALREKGFQISKSGIHRYGQRLERRLSAIRASTEAAKLLSETVDDESAALSESVVAMIQTDMFNVMVGLQEAGEQEDPEKRMRMLSGAANSVAELVRASVSLKKHQAQVRTRIEQATEAAEQIARKGGLSADAWQEIRREFLGISE